jgi:glycolate oxidase FAD binding subunit
VDKSLAELQDRIRAAADRATPLRVRGGGSKDFYGNEPRGELLDTRAHAGIAAYEPSELVLTARCGTPLAEVEQALAERGQCLPFEPPHFGAATFGGCIASGLSGPRRAAAGALRDFVLGVKLVDGKGRVVQFGGQVMKNVAGYDVSRLVAGSLGTLGVIAEASLKVLPRPAAEVTLRLEMSEGRAIEMMNRWAGQPLPISATAWHQGQLAVRLSGAPVAVESAVTTIGGAEISDSASFWKAIREHTHPFFGQAARLWRIALPSTAAPLGLPGPHLMEWSGALRWVASAAKASEVRDIARRNGGHATLFRATDKAAGAFAPLEPVLLRLHRQLKSAFDPAGILNPGRLYPEL